jgi:hypothetical protein
LTNIFQNEKKAKELDVDFIGGQNNPLTKEEQLAISVFIKQLQKKNSKGKIKKKLEKQSA